MNQDHAKPAKLASWDDFQYDRLQQIPRELRFFPSDSHRAKSLSSQQVDAYNQLGFLTGIQLFDAHEAAEIRPYLGWHEKGVVCRGEDLAGHWANYPPPQEE